MSTKSNVVSENVQGFLNFINQSPTAFHCKTFCCYFAF